MLNTATLPAVTHVRGANDYCVRAMNDSWRIGAAAGLFWSVGLYTTKDTFFSSSNETTTQGGPVLGFDPSSPPQDRARRPPASTSGPFRTGATYGGWPPSPTRW